MTDARLPLSRALAYAAPGFALAIPLVPVFTFLPTLYARDVGLGLARTGTVLFVARAVDFLLDPLIGLGAAAGGAFYALDLAGFDPNAANGAHALFALAAT